MARDSRRNRHQWGPMWNVRWDSWVKNYQGSHMCLPTSRFTKSVTLMHSHIQGEQVQIVLEGRTLSAASLGKLLWPSGLILLALPIQALVSVWWVPQACSLRVTHSSLPTASCSFVLCPPILFHNKRSQGCLFAVKSQIPLMLILGGYTRVSFSQCHPLFLSVGHLSSRIYTPYASKNGLHEAIFPLNEGVRCLQKCIVFFSP